MNKWREKIVLDSVPLSQVAWCNQGGSHVYQLLLFWCKFIDGFWKWVIPLMYQRKCAFTSLGTFIRLFQSALSLLLAIFFFPLCMCLITHADPYWNYEPSVWELNSYVLYYLAQVPARAAAAAAVARALAGLPPHQRFNLPSSSEGLRSIYGSIPHGQIVDELEEDFYEEVLLTYITLVPIWECLCFYCLSIVNTLYILYGIGISLTLFK